MQQACARKPCCVTAPCMTDLSLRFLEHSPRQGPRSYAAPTYIKHDSAVHRGLHCPLMWVSHAEGSIFYLCTFMAMLQVHEKGKTFWKVHNLTMQLLEAGTEHDFVIWVVMCH